MNITKHYPRIVKALYESPWMILPSAHEILRRAFEAHLANGQSEIPVHDMISHLADDRAQIPLDIEDDEDEDIDDAELAMKPNIAVITIEGVIGKRLGLIEQCMGGVDVDNIAAALDEVVEDPDIETIVLDFCTPGGSVTGVPELAAKIAEVSEKKKCIGYADVLCASAGYYLASQCNAFYCAASADIGSVGVYSIYTDQTRALEDEGIKVNAISAGKYKLMGASFKPMSDEERAMLQADVDKIYNQFKGAVTSKRTIADEDMQGQVFDGETAVMKGFADGIVSSLNELLKGLGQTNL